MSTFYRRRIYSPEKLGDFPKVTTKLKGLLCRQSQVTRVQRAPWETTKMDAIRRMTKDSPGCSSPLTPSSHFLGCDFRAEDKDSHLTALSTPPTPCRHRHHGGPRFPPNLPIPFLIVL